MTKLNYFATIVSAICLFVLPSSGLAKMTQMTDTELEQTTAQAGFSDVLGVFQIDKDDETGSYYFGSDETGYISLSDIDYTGSTGLDPAIVATNTISTNGATGVEYVLDGNIIEIDNFTSTIRTGSEPGTGDSFGTLHIDGMVLNVNGTLRLTAE